MKLPISCIGTGGGGRASLSFRIIALLLLAVMTLGLLVSCGENKTYTFEEFSFTIPKKMRKTPVEGVDMCYSSIEAAISVQKMTADKLSALDLDETATVKELTDAFFEKNGIDANQCYLTFEEEQNAYKFRYSFSPDGENMYFHYVVMIGEVGKLYFVDMTADYEKSPSYLSVFGDWADSFKVR